MNELTHIDLFSGIGGFALAARWNGIKTVQFVEIDPFCQKVLNKNFEGVPIHDDITTFTNTESVNNKEQISTTFSDREIIAGWENDIWPESRGLNDFTQRPFLLTGGFPCQPFSCAGKRKGTSDSRHLWPHMLRVIQEFKPKWIIGENVPGIINIKGMEQQDGESDLESETFNDGSDGQPSTVLIGILNDLEQAGYSVQIFVIPACAVNAPHRRDRVWIVANSTRGDRITGREQQRIHTEKNEWEWSNKSETQNSGNELGNRENKSNSYAPDSTGIGNKSVYHNRNAESVNGQSSNKWDEPWLEVATRLCRVDARVSNRVDRLKSLGNAIVPQVAYEIMKAILKVENEI